MRTVGAGTGIGASPWQGQDHSLCFSLWALQRSHVGLCLCPSTVKEPLRASAHSPPPSPSIFGVSPGASRISGVFSPAHKRGQPWLPRCLPSPVSPEHKWLPQTLKTGTLTLFWWGPYSSLSAHCKSTSTAPRPQLRIRSCLSVSAPKGPRAHVHLAGAKPYQFLRSRAAEVKVRTTRAPASLSGHLGQKGTRMDLYREPTGCECVAHWGPLLLGFGACSGAELGRVTQGSDRGGLGALLVQINSFQD